MLDWSACQYFSFSDSHWPWRITAEAEWGGDEWMPAGVVHLWGIPTLFYSLLYSFSLPSLCCSVLLFHHISFVMSQFVFWLQTPAKSYYDNYWANFNNAVCHKIISTGATCYVSPFSVTQASRWAFIARLTMQTCYKPSSLNLAAPTGEVSFPHYVLQWEFL